MMAPFWIAFGSSCADIGTREYKITQQIANKTKTN